MRPRRLGADDAVLDATGGRASDDADAAGHPALRDFLRQHADRWYAPAVGGATSTVSPASRARALMWCAVSAPPGSTTPSSALRREINQPSP